MNGFFYVGPKAMDLSLLGAFSIDRSGDPETLETSEDHFQGFHTGASEQVYILHEPDRAALVPKGDGSLDI